MAKIICITTGLTGILNASLELVSRLKAEGHEVEYAAPRSVGHVLSQEGIPFTELPVIAMNPGPEVPNFKGLFRKVLRWKYKLQNKNKRAAEALEKTRPTAFEEMIRFKKPDFILIDIELHEYIFKAHQLNQEFVLLSQWFSLWREKSLPYLLSETIPGKGWSGSNLFIALNWRKVKLKRWWTFTKKKIVGGGSDRRSILKKLAKELEFPMHFIRENYWPGPFTYSEIPIWSMTCFEMEFPHEKRKGLSYVGPMVFDTRKEVNSISRRNYTIAEVLEYTNKINGKLLYLNLSTVSKGDRTFLKKMIQVLKKRREWVLVVAGGELIGEETFKNIPGNVFLFNSVPQIKVLRKSDLSINHGGIHTINECVHFGIPMLVYSGKKSDQNGCAARVAYHGLGLIGDKDIDGVAKIDKNIRKVLFNEKFKQRVHDMREKIEYYKTEKIVNNKLKEALV